MKISASSRTIGVAFVAVVSACVLSPAFPAQAGSSCQPALVGKDSFCEVGGVRLHYVDYGGVGPALILLSGLGDSARIYDDLAPRLTSVRHVYAFTRRGYGQSQNTPGDYGSKALVADVIGLMDGLGIARADLVGHSIAGEELTLLGEQHPDRVRRIVYLDAAYDRSRALEFEAGDPVHRVPPPSALTGYAAFDAWREAALGVNSAAIRANDRQIMTWTGAALKARTPPATALAVLSGDVAAKPHYDQIDAPALAIYSGKQKPEQIPPETPTALVEASRRYGLRVIRPWMLRQQANFLATIRCGVAVEAPDAGHYIYLERPAWTATTILSFLESPTPCAWQAP